ncbi:MAG: serine hydrolase domain-containing protein [Bacteroidota bacterium]
MQQIIRWAWVALLWMGCRAKDPVYYVERIETRLERLVKYNRSLGISYALKLDSIDISGAYGKPELGSGQTVDPTHQFRIASITKPLTATAIMQLIEADSIGLDTKLNRFFPAYPLGEDITLYQLLSHTSGIPNWYEAAMPADQPPDFPMCPSPHQYLAHMEPASHFTPGTAFAYSNSGYVLLGEIIELVSGLPYATYLQQHIFAPAGMTQTEMEYIERRPGENWVRGYAFNPEADPPFVAPESYHMPFSAGGLRSTPHDLQLFLDALLHGKLLPADRVEEMMRYATLADGRPVYENPYTPDGTPPQFPSNVRKFGYGLGFEIVENFGMKEVFHGGGIAGFNGMLIYIPHNRLRLTILSNTEDGIMPELMEIEQAAISIERNE